MPATVDALLPLSLLEAVRAVDTPQGDLEAEYVNELRNKRLGLSDTVYAQIRRYTDLVKRSQRPQYEEAVALATLIGRRPDAATVFSGAGQFLAREAYLTIPASTRKMLRLLPDIIARPLALRHARRICERYLNGVLARHGGFVTLEVSESVTLASASGSTGCVFYEAALRELMRLLVGHPGAVQHVRCAARGEGICEWRGDWRS